MKRITLSLAVMAIAAASCQKPEAAFPVAEQFTATVESFESPTKTSMTPEKYVVWSQNDRLAIFQGSTLADEYKIDDASAGKANATFNKVTTAGDGFYAGTEILCNVALYPYEEGLTLIGTTLEEGAAYKVEGVVLPSEQVYAAGSFADGAFPMVAVTDDLSDHNLKFKNVLGTLKLQLKGTQTVKSIKVTGRSNEILSGTAVVTAYTNGLTPAITMTGSDDASKSVTLNCGDGIQLNEGTATAFIISLPPVLFTQGFTVTVTESNDETYTIETDKANTVLRSSILTMPAFTLGQTPGDDAEDDELVIPVSSIELSSSSLKLYETYTANLTATVRPKDATDQTVVWSSDDPSVATVDQTGKITGVSAGTATISAVAGGVIATCDVTVKTLTLVDYVDEYGVNHEKGVLIGGTTVWAPVNCGYKAATASDKGYPYGKLYQWGRKYGQGYDENDASVPTFSEGGVSEVGGNHKSNENVFYVGFYDWADGRNDELWNSGTEASPVKTAYDPCPTGWRVPTCAELEELCQNYSEWTTNEAGQSGLWFSGSVLYSEDVAQVFFPAAGSRDYDNGSAYNRGSSGSYWSSRSLTDYAYRFDFYGGGADRNYNLPANGYSVRCVQE